MKKLILYTIMLFAVCITATAQVSLDFESGNRSTDAGNCWVFGAVSYTSNSGQRITGSWSGRSNSMSNPSPSSAWIKSPFLKPGSGNITFNVKLENTSGTTKSILVRFISYDANNTTTGEGNFLTDTFRYNWSSISTSVKNLSYAIPSSIANSGTPYKVMISFFGTGGNNRCDIDDIVIPGTYWADPSNNCLPLPIVQDADGDGVADADDDFPNDQYRAFRYYISGEDFGTLLCEDMWPTRGDYDFNDLVFDYRLSTIANADNNLVELHFEIVTRAIGGSFHNGFACEMTGIAPNKVLSVSGNKLDGTLFTVSSNGTEAGQTWANIPFFDDAFKVLSYPGGTGGINTNPNAPKADYDSMVVVVTFMQNGTPASGGTVSLSEFLDKTLNPYLVVNKTRNKEIHMMDYPPTSLASSSYFGTNDDASNPSSNLFYRSKNNLPWMIAVPRSIPYTTEKTEFSTAFSKFVNWAQSEGSQYEDWYLDENGYRNLNNLYNK